MAPLAEDELHQFYEDCYAPAADEDSAERSRIWRELSAVGKADHVAELWRRAGLASPATVAEVGCGDGAVLAELGRRGFGSRLVGLEISSTGARLAASRPEITEASVFDGVLLPASDGEYDLAFATHVFEHIPDPRQLMAEMARASKAVVIEVPLEDNLSARRPAGRVASEGVGHLQRFDRAEIRQLVRDSGLEIRGELIDPLPRSVHTYWAESRSARLRGTAKWALRRAVAAVPPIGVRLVTMHYAVLATRPSAAA
jgi:SAM-dependent methyltransferase